MKTATGSTLITNGQLVDGTGGPVISEATVLVTDGKITYVGPAADCPEIDAETIDARGGTIMPGLTEALPRP